MDREPTNRWRPSSTSGYRAAAGCWIEYGSAPPAGFYQSDGGLSTFTYGQA